MKLAIKKQAKGFFSRFSLSFQAGGSENRSSCDARICRFPFAERPGTRTFLLLNRRLLLNKISPLNRQLRIVRDDAVHP